MQKKSKYLTEALGTMFLVLIVVGSGIMAEKLSKGNDAIALLGNAVATGCGLFVLIKMFEKDSSHFNPVVSFFFYLKKEINLATFLIYSFLQIVFAILGVWICHFIFEVEMFQLSHKVRGSYPMIVSEAIATFGLILTILMISRNDKKSVAIGVALFITAGYWFTSSTSFANPAVTIARVFTDTFTGIAPQSILFFIFGQIIGVISVFFFCKFLRKCSSDDMDNCCV